MKWSFPLLVIYLFIAQQGAWPFQQPATVNQVQPSAAMTNQDVINMWKAEISPAIIIAKIKSSPEKFDTSAVGLAELKAARVPDNVVLVMIRATASRTPAPSARQIDNLTALFENLQNSVVTVWSEIGHGTGFIIGKEGLILTNQHVIGPSKLIAVQFDPKRKVQALLLAADPENDIAVLVADIHAFPRAIGAPIAKGNTTQPTVVEGERVFTIGSPLSQRKILTTGTVSKVDPGAIISDININPGNSGGPLFNSLGQVVGLTTFGEQESHGPGVAGIIRIEKAEPLLEKARAELAATPRHPSSTLLPVEPAGTFPLDAIKKALGQKKFKLKPYLFKTGQYNVEVITPEVKYWMENRSEIEGARRKGKRTRKAAGAIQGTLGPFEGLKSWKEYAGEYKPVIQIVASPQLAASFWSAFAGGYYGTPIKMHFKTDFYRMRLLCDGVEVQPIHPTKIANRGDERSAFVKISDATYVGFYTYPFDAISPKCKVMDLEIYSEESPKTPTVQMLNPKLVSRVWSDLEPYRKAKAKLPSSN